MDKWQLVGREPEAQLDTEDEPKLPEDCWFPVESRFPDEACPELQMRAIKRMAGSGEMLALDMPHYGNGHIAVLHLAGAKVPVSITLWMDDSADRLARITRLGTQRYVVELSDADGSGVLADPTADQVPTPVRGDERDILEHDVIAPAQIIVASLNAEAAARIWLERAELPRGLQLSSWPSH